MKTQFREFKDQNAFNPNYFKPARLPVSTEKSAFTAFGSSFHALGFSGDNERSKFQF